MSAKTIKKLLPSGRMGGSLGGAPIPLNEHRPGLIWEIRDYVMIAIGTLLYTGGVSLFMLPYRLTTGGVSGVSSIIYYAAKIPVSLSYGLINACFLVVAVKVLGWKFCLKTIAGVASSTLWLALWQLFLTKGGTSDWPHICGDQIFMACILGPLICGIGLSICFENNGSTGGTDIIAAIVSKFKDVSLGQIILLCDILIISSCYFVFHDVQRVVFGYVIMIVCAFTLDYCTRMKHQAVEVKVYSRNYSMIADALIEEGFGVTVVDGMGWYTRSERKVIVTVCSKRYQQIVMRAIKHVDPFAFISVSNLSSVFGEGFSTLKTKLKDQKPILVFCTDNLDKLTYARQALGDRYEIRSLKEIGCRKTEIKKIKDNLHENTINEARYVHKYYGFDCFADNKKDGIQCLALIRDGKETLFRSDDEIIEFLLK